MIRWVSAQEAAKHYGCTVNAIRKRANRGSVTTKNTKEGLRYLISEAPKRKTARAIKDQKPFRKIMAVFDVHVPDHDVKAWSLFLECVRDEQPDEIILGGDFLELESCSQHGGNANPKALLEEIKAGREALEALREAAPDATITYLEGNHETRLQRITWSQIPTFDGALSIPALLDLPSLGIAWHPYGEIVNRGKLGFTHGWWANEHHAAKHLRELQISVAYGHTHRPNVHTKGTADGHVRGAFGMPCMRSLNASWLWNRPVGWMQGFGVFYIMPNGNFTPYMVLMNDRSFVWNGKLYA